MEDFLESFDLNAIMNEMWRRKASKLIRRARQVETQRNNLGMHAEGSGFEADSIQLLPVFKATAIESLSAAMKLLAMSSATHIEATWSTIPTENPLARSVALNPLAVYTLLRASLENSSLGLWVTRPEQSSERVSNYAGLLLYSQKRYWNALDSHSDDGRLINSPPITEQKLRNILESSEILPSSKPSSTELLKCATKHESSSALSWTPLVSWKVASGIAHGIPWATEEASKISISAETKRASVRIDLESFHHVLAASVQLLDALVSRIEHLNGVSSDSARR